MGLEFSFCLSHVMFQEIWFYFITSPLEKEVYLGEKEGMGVARAGVEGMATGQGRAEPLGAEPNCISPSNPEPYGEGLNNAGSFLVF